MVIAILPRKDSHFRVANLNPAFKTGEFDLTYNGSEWDAGLVSPAEGGCWDNYFKVALLECVARFFPGGKPKAGVEASGPVGMDVLITGNVPHGAGLSVGAGVSTADSRALPPLLSRLLSPSSRLTELRTV